MSTLSIRLPDSLHKKVKELARQEGISMNPFIALVVGAHERGRPAGRATRNVA